MKNYADLALLYGGENVAAQTERYHKLARRFAEAFPAQGAPRFFSAPGRTEISGNHTDHQFGRVLAASVNLDTIAAARENGGSVVNIHSEGYAPIRVDLSNLTPVPEEIGTTAGIIRGCAAYMREAGFAVGGFDATVTSTVFSGSGLSSSAAFEILINKIFDCLFNAGDLDAALSARIAQKSENNFFGKPSGLMDQTASSVGGMVAIDFEKPEAKIEALNYDFTAKGYELAIIGTGSSHDDLTDAYAAIPREMREVAAFFGEEHLRPVSAEAFYAKLPELYGKVSDRAILRAMHFFDENARVPQQVEALRNDDLPRFLQLVIESGESSWKLLQNIYATEKEQSLAIALALTARILKDCGGAWRVHGGGFAGTILAFVPHAKMPEYREKLDAVFGKGACVPLQIRPVGAAEVKL